MAITKLLHIKERNTGNAALGLKNAINYIMNPSKTENGYLVDSNCGLTAEEIYNSCVETKKKYGKTKGRQGYHFIISFSPEEEVSAGICMEVLKEFANKYLNNEYDYVVAVHNDTDHMHGHLVFNSVNSKTTLKYRYENGDWQKNIQPIVDKITSDFNLKKLDFKFETEEDKTADYKPQNWMEIIKKDIDSCIQEVKSYDEFCVRLKEQYNYQIREGVSKKHGIYLTFKPQGKSKAVRSYNMPIDYQPYIIKSRIEGSITKTLNMPLRNSSFRKGYVKFSKRKYIKYKDMSAYQKYVFKKMMRNRAVFNNKKTYISWETQKTIDEMNRSSEELAYLIKHNLKDNTDINERYNQLIIKRKEVANQLRLIKKQYSTYLYGKPSIFSKFEMYLKVVHKKKKTDIEENFIHNYADSNDIEYISMIYNSYVQATESLKKERYDLSREIKFIKRSSNDSSYIINEKIKKKIALEHKNEYTISININGEKGNLLQRETENTYITRIPGTMNIIEINKINTILTNNDKTIITFLPKDGMSIYKDKYGKQITISNKELYENHYVFDKQYNSVKTAHKVQQHTTLHR